MFIDDVGTDWLISGLSLLQSNPIGREKQHAGICHSRRLAAVVGGKWFKDDPESLVSYSYDATPLYQAMPDGVIFPGSTQEVSDIVKICSKHRIPVITRAQAKSVRRDHSASGRPDRGHDPYE